ncbi:MAG: carotenoid 1,2-hydratase [Pseudomonadota bacterium]
MPAEGFRFNEPVPPGGYVWWYLDGVSEDGAHAITVIVFIGSVFSPYYAWAGKRDPENHVAVNVALYGRPARWAMTERGRRHAHRSADGFHVRTSGITWDGTTLKVDIDERCAPLPRALKGTIFIRPDALSAKAYPIDADGAHMWRPIAPSTRIEVDVATPGLSWRGNGYLDMNWGSVPLERTFSHWDWMRVDLGEGRSAIFYETEELGEGAKGQRLALLCGADGSAEPIAPPPRHPLARTLWRVPRAAWSEGAPPVVRRTLEDAPFYVRTEVEMGLFGAKHTAIQESLSLRRFTNPVVKLMLPFRMPRLP